jgi:hypothetical protein
MSGGCDALNVGVACFVVVIVIVVGRSCNPRRVLLSPFLAALGILLSALDDDDGWCCFAAAGDHFPTAWDRERFDCLLVGGILDGHAEQLLSGVPKNVIRCMEGRRLLCVMHTTPDAFDLVP